MVDHPSSDVVHPTQEENGAYQQFVSTQMTALLGGTPQRPTTLWHYTSGENLINIVRSGELWSTQVSCLNDQLELRYAQSLLLRALFDLRAERQLSEDETFFVDLGIERLNEERTNTSEWFVACFSRRDDDLSQWRAYGLGEGGYSIGFSVDEMIVRGGPDQAYVAPVCYDVTRHEAAAKSVAAASLSFFIDGLTRRKEQREAWAEAFLLAWGDAITYLAPVIKHPSFASEEEFRIVRRLRDEDFPNMTFRQKQTLMARHLPLKFSQRDGDSKLLPLTHVRVGPSRNRHVSRISVADLLRTYKYPLSSIQILETTVPFQTV